MKLRLKYWLFILGLSAGGPQVAAQKAEVAELEALYDKAFGYQGESLDSMHLFSKELYTASTAAAYPKGVAQARLLSAYFYTMHRKTDTASVLIAQAMQFFAQQPDRNSMEWGLVNLYQGLNEFYSGRYEEAQNSYRLAHEIFSARQDVFYQAYCLTSMGVLETTRANYPLALEYCSEAYRMKVEAGFPPERCKYEVTSLAKIYTSIGDYRRALAFDKKILAIEEGKGRDLYIGQACLSIGNSYYWIKQLDSALYFYNRGLEHAKKAKFMAMVTACQNNIANITAEVGDLEQSNRLLYDFNNGFKKPEDRQNHYGLYLTGLNYHKLGNHRKAIGYGREAIAGYQKKRNKQYALYVSELLRDAYDSLEILDSVLYYSSLYYTYKDSIFNEENNAKVSKLYAEIAGIEKENEIAALQKEAEVSALETKFRVLLFVSVVVVCLLALAAIVSAYRNKVRKHKLVDEQLRKELQRGKLELEQQTLHMYSLNEKLTYIEAELKRLKKEATQSAPKVQKVLNSISINKSLEKDWDNFDNYFGKVHLSFYENLQAMHPDLSRYELRMCALIKLNLSNKEIATILNIEPKSVRMAKYRLKKKMKLEDEKGIGSYFQSV